LLLPKRKNTGVLIVLGKRKRQEVLILSKNSPRLDICRYLLQINNSIENPRSNNINDLHKKTTDILQLEYT